MPSFHLNFVFFERGNRDPNQVNKDFKGKNVKEIANLAERGLSGKVLLKYLQTEQPYRIITEPATWSGLSGPGTRLEGQLGSHASIVLPGNRVLEWAGGVDLAHNIKEPHTLRISQEERRRATGAVVEKMWQQGQALIDSEFSFKDYRPMRRDCFTYVDCVLEQAGQEKVTVKRSTVNEPQLREIVGNISDVMGTYQRVKTLFSSDAPRQAPKKDDVVVYELENYKLS